MVIINFVNKFKIEVGKFVSPSKASIIAFDKPVSIRELYQYSNLKIVIFDEIVEGSEVYEKEIEIIYKGNDYSKIQPYFSNVKSLRFNSWSDLDNVKQLDVKYLFCTQESKVDVKAYNVYMNSLTLELCYFDNEIVEKHCKNNKKRNTILWEKLEKEEISFCKIDDDGSMVAPSCSQRGTCDFAKSSNFLSKCKDREQKAKHLNKTKWNKRK